MEQELFNEEDRTFVGAIFDNDPEIGVTTFQDGIQLVGDHQSKEDMTMTWPCGYSYTGRFKNYYPKR